jgi:predicted ATP-dependent protease
MPDESQAGPQRLPASELRWSCPAIEAAEAPAREGMLIGQDRAIEAIRLGTELYAPGFNLFVSGLSGVSRGQGVKSLLEGIGPACRLALDHVFVFNFRDPHKPRLLSLGRRRGPEFSADMDALVGSLSRLLPKALTEGPVHQRRLAVVRKYQERQSTLLEELARRCARAGQAVVQVQAGALTVPDVFPVVNGKPVAREELDRLVETRKLTARKRTTLLQRRERIAVDLERVRASLRNQGRQMDGEIKALEVAAARELLDVFLQDMVEKWSGPAVQAYLIEVREFLLRSLDRFTRESGPAAASGQPSEDEPPRPPKPEPSAEHAGEVGSDDPEFLYTPPGARALLPELSVRVVSTHADDKCPIVVEANPTFVKLFGTIERGPDDRDAALDRIHPGSLLLADGGYLILALGDVAAEHGVWQTLKRVLKSGLTEISYFDPGQLTTGAPLQPEPIPVNVKVVLIGESGTYDQLGHEDPDFLKIFKIHAEFDTEIERTPDNLLRYAGFIRYLTENEKLLRFDPEAVGAVAEFGARAAGRRTRLTAKFSEIADLVREASYQAGRGNQGTVDRAAVRGALLARRRRHGLPEDRLVQYVKDRVLLMSMSGAVVGQVNALTVWAGLVHEFGRPIRITATTGVGPGLLVNIEREAELSGPVHDKGVMILAGYLRNRFGQDKPLCLSAGICFEQSYDGVEGDSASSTELYALLSSLAGIPIRQSVAVTGSVNQFGEVQAIGGVNEKIEGFFRVCRVVGLTGEQGVLIPTANINDLMLDEEVVAAVAEGRFHVHAVANVDQGLEALTGRPAAEVLAAADQKLRAFAAAMRGLGPIGL